MFTFSIERINFIERLLNNAKLFATCARDLISLNNISAAPTDDIAKDTVIQNSERPRT